MPGGRGSSRHSWGKKLWILLVNRKEFLWVLSKEEQPRGTSVWDDKAGDGVLAQPCERLYQHSFSEVFAKWFFFILSFIFYI
jgi:hypothetical protein